jgi:hypothetical protein
MARQSGLRGDGGGKLDEGGGHGCDRAGRPMRPARPYLRRKKRIAPWAKRRSWAAAGLAFRPRWLGCGPIKRKRERSSMRPASCF